MDDEIQICKSDIRGRVIKLIAAIARAGVNSLSDASELSADLGIDSLDHVNLIFDLEVEFDIRIGDDDAEGVRTVGDVVRIVQASLVGIAAYRDPYFHA